MIEVKNKVINLVKVLGRILNKTSKPRRYSEIKKIVKTFIDTSQYLIQDALVQVAINYGVADWKLSGAQNILEEAYRVSLVKDDILREIIDDIDSYEEDCYKELEMRIYDRLPEYCKVMIETTNLWIEN